MRYVLYAFLAAALAVAWANHSERGKVVKRQLTKNHVPEWKQM